MEKAEYSFVMIKPDGKQHEREIIDRIEAAEVNGVKLKIIARKEIVALPEILAKHYPLEPEYLLTMGHVDPSGWTEEQKQAQIEKMRERVTEMHQFMQSGPVVPMIVVGPEGTVDKIREIVGKTNPADAAPGTIRGDFGTDSYAAADEEGRAVRNLIHASGNPKEGKDEIKIWYEELYQELFPEEAAA